MNLPVCPPLEPMLATLARSLPEVEPGSVWYEPKWDGFRGLVFRDGDELELQSRNGKPLLRYFPELAPALLQQLPTRCVLDGEIMVVTERGLDFDALQSRQHPAASRVQRLAAQIPASFVAFDLLAEGDASLLEVPFGRRRDRLEQLLAGARPPIFLTPATQDPQLAADWFARFGGGGFDGVMVKPVEDTYRPGVRALIKVKHERTMDAVIAGFRLHKDGAGVGSLLLGLFDDAGRLHHVGVASGMAAAQRRRLLDALRPFETDGHDHPWRHWAGSPEAQASAPLDADTGVSGARMPGGPSRWNAGKDLAWTPLRIALVAEVAFEGMLGDRLRHNARFRRLRSDRDPASCTYGQLEVIPPVELAALLRTDMGREPS